MAPVDELPRPLTTYLEKEFQDIITRYDKLWEVEDPEETPYKSKYEARALLESALKEVEKILAGLHDEEEVEKGKEAVAMLHLFLGKNYYYCEEVPTGEMYLNRALESYLRSPLRTTPKPFIRIQDVLNQLGMLWCNRQNHAEGMNFLRRAQIMYMNQPEEVKKAEGSRIEDNYTLTMFYLAQAYGALQKPALSALFCAKTMSRQLELNSSGRRSKEVTERDPFDCKDWIRNCCSLSDFFSNEGMFWTSEYLLHSASVMAEKCQEICGFAPDGLPELRAEVMRDMGNHYSTRLKFAKACCETPGYGEEAWRGERKPPRKTEVNPEGSKLTFRCAADREDKGQDGPIQWDEIFPEVVHLEDEEALDKQLSEETEDRAASKEVDEAGWLEVGPGERVRLPVYFRRLHEKVQERMHRANGAFLKLRGEPASVEVPANPQGDDEEPASEVPMISKKQPSCIGTTFETSRHIFRLGNHYFAKALQYFQMDGWVTEHVRILQEISQMYKTLLFWEKDRKRTAAMLTRRVRMLGPVVDIINPKVYVAFWKQLTFEVAEVYQALYELKALGAMPSMASLAQELQTEAEEEAPGSHEEIKQAARCNDLARKSVEFYGKFVESYHPDGKVPDRVDDDNIRVYLTARINRARIRTKSQGSSLDEQIEEHKLALREYEWILNYGKRHPEVRTNPELGMIQEMRLCEEMASMLPSQLGRLAARRRR